MALINGINLDGTIIKDTLSGIGGLIRDVRVAITGVDPQKAAEIEAKLLEIEERSMTAQIEVNKAEATNPNILVSGARPAAMWVCVAGFAYTFLGYPMLVWASSNFGWVSPPNIDASIMMNLLYGMLGLGAFRTVEKVKNVARS